MPLEHRLRISRHYRFPSRRSFADIASDQIRGSPSVSQRRVFTLSLSLSLSQSRAGLSHIILSSLAKPGRWRGNPRRRGRKHQSRCLRPLRRGLPRHLPALRAGRKSSHAIACIAGEARNGAGVYSFAGGAPLQWRVMILSAQDARGPRSMRRRVTGVVHQRPRWPSRMKRLGGAFVEVV